MKIWLVGLFLVASSVFAEEAEDSITCVRRCTQRTVMGTCMNHGPDFCAQGEGVACIPHCNQRSIHLQCQNYTRDFCGRFPECQAHCVQVSVNGQCLQYGADKCYAIDPEWP